MSIIYKISCYLHQNVYVEPHNGLIIPILHQEKIYCDYCGSGLTSRKCQESFYFINVQITRASKYPNFPPLGMPQLHLLPDWEVLATF